MLNLVRTSGPAESGAVAASVIARALRPLPAPVLGVATGSSPLPIYAQLGGTGIDWARATVFGLDEYVGLPPGHEQSYWHFIQAHVARPLGIPAEQVHLPDVHGDDLGLAAYAYEEEIRRAGGVDLQIVGIGRNGHLAFNEPGSPLDSRTRVVELTADTRAANARFFEHTEDVPRQAMTQGIGTILEARSILLVADGEAKREALRAALHGPVTPDNPASALQLHANVTVVTDCELEPVAR